MSRWILAGLAGALFEPTLAAQIEVPGPDAGTRRFGADVIVLPGGNFLVTDPEWSIDQDTTLVGAVYLYSANSQLLSRLTGDSAGDQVGSGGIVVLPNGNFVVRSPAWRASPVAGEAGAVSWGDADTGFGVSAKVSAANSLIGSSAGDRVGASAVVPLANNSYVVASSEWDRPGVGANAGAVTWCADDGSTVGPITKANSLIGATAEDQVGDTTVLGTPGVIALRSGHYVVTSNYWDNGGVANVGAVTWAHNDGSVVDEVSAANSLIGSSEGEHAGAAVQALANGSYIVRTPYFDNGGGDNVGAVTWADGNGPTAAVVSATNSLIGSQDFDFVGRFAAVLSNGNYVVASPFWDSGTIENAGAVTWRDGSGPSPGVVDAINSLVGSASNDSLGYITLIGIPPLGVVPLANGHYLVASPEWDNGAVGDVGAATWASGTQGIAGLVSVQNSIIGASQDDAIAQYILALDSGNFVVASPFWSQQRGAATWGNGQGGTVGVVGEANSLVGSQPNDFVTSSGVYPLLDGDYVVGASQWNQGKALRVGAATRGSGSSGITGPVSAQNSVVGTEANDRVGSGGVTSLPGGDFLVRSALASGFGAITRTGFPTFAGPSIVTTANSLVGNSMEDRLGGPGASVTADGTIVVHTAAIAANGAGAVTLFEKSDPFVGTIVEEDTVRSATQNGGSRLNHDYLASSATLVVGDPLSNRIVLLKTSRIFRDGYEAAGD